ncbi:MAG TPA: universal stress protein [Pseudonocardiaceae bacterium]|nr:universal stress protein [Pseudonocardiaceae bacterium]
MTSSDIVGTPIVVGIDGSESARHAARWAADEATRGHLPLRLVSAVFAALPGYAAGGDVSPDLIDELQTVGRQQVDDVRAELATSHPDVEVTTEVVFAPATPALIDESRAARMLVLGSRGLGGFTGILVGSHAVALAAHGHCPVAVIRDDPGTGPVVVGIDGSPASAAAVALAFEEASLRGADLVAVHTWSDHPWEAAYANVPVPIDWDAVRTEEEQVLAERLAGWQEKYPDVSVRRDVAKDRPADHLLRVAASAQLLVVGSRGRGGFTGMVLGSTSQALVYHATCPLLVARPS